jgi:hypothetical protein
MTIPRSMVLPCEAHRDRKKRNLADTGQPKVLVNAVILVPSFMTPPGKLRPNSEPIVLPVTKAKVTALLPEEEKEEAKEEEKERDQVLTGQLAAKAAAAQKVRVDLVEKAAKASVPSREIHVQQRVEAPLPLARQICLCASITSTVLATKVKTARFLPHKDLQVPQGGKMQKGGSLLRLSRQSQSGKTCCRQQEEAYSES